MPSRRDPKDPSSDQNRSADIPPLGDSTPPQAEATSLPDESEPLEPFEFQTSEAAATDDANLQITIAADWPAEFLDIGIPHVFGHDTSESPREPLAPVRFDSSASPQLTGTEPHAPFMLPPTAIEYVTPFDPLRSSAADSPPIAHAIYLPGQESPFAFERGPYVPDATPQRPSIQLLSHPEGQPAAASGAAAELSPRTRGMLAPTADGGPPLARPIVLLSLSGELTQKIIHDALEAALDRDEKTLVEIAEEKVNYAFWLRDCHLRALR